MSKWWNTYCVAVLAFALTGCSTYRDLRDWWTEDQGEPTEKEWAEYRALYRGEGETPASPPAADPARVAGGDTTQRRERRPAPIYEAPIQEPRLAPITTSPQPPGSAPAKKPLRAENAPVVRSPAPSPPPAPPVASLTPPAEAPAVNETASVAEVPIVPPSLVSVAGMSEARLRELLGAPTTTTERGAQKIWRYAGNGCSVEVIFFRDVTRNTYAALEQTTRARDNSVSSSPCLRSAPVQGPSG